MCRFCCDCGITLCYCFIVIPGTIIITIVIIIFHDYYYTAIQDGTYEGSQPQPDNRSEERRVGKEC